MAEGDDGQEKTEDPTPRKREKAREDGQIVTSKEMFVFMSVAGGTLMFLIGKSSLDNVVGIWAHYLQIDHADNMDALMITRIGDMLWHTGVAGVGIGVPLIALIIMLQAGLGGLIFSTKSLGLKISKANPIKGLGRMVSKQALMELVKAVLKVTLLIAAAAIVMIPTFPEIESMSSMATGDSIALLGTITVQILAAMLIGLAIIGGIDLGFQIYSNTEKLKMSRQEIKDENKDTEGSPEIKGRMRQLQMQASQNGAKRRAALEDVGTASAIITNPTHFAVALRYEPGMTQAPVIVAMGRGPMAQDIMKRAKKAQVQIVQVPPLARALFYTGEVGEEIAEQLYTAVATILAYVYRLDRGDWDIQPDVDLPTNLRLDEFGRPEQETT